jgi:hypothetical protein
MDVHRRGETLPRCLDGRAPLRRSVAALGRWTCIGDSKHCRAGSMDLHRRSEALPRWFDPPALP